MSGMLLGDLIQKMTRVVALDFHNPADFQRWQDYIISRPDTHCSDVAEWRLLLHELYGIRSYGFACLEHERVVGVACVSLIASPFFGRLLVSSPFFGYGGLYADSRAIQDRLLKEVEHTAQELDVDFIELRLRQALPRPYTTHTGFQEFDLELRPPAENVWQEQLSSNVRQNIRKSRRSPIIILGLR